MAEANYVTLEAEAIEMIRESARDTIEFNRRRQRDEEIDLRRAFATMGLQSDPVEDVIKKLKSKSITSKELSSLKNAMIQDSDVISMVLKEHGALFGLVREITGHNAEKQYHAIGCICNLALGNCKAKATVAKHTGPYVILLLDNHNVELKKISAWTLKNLAGCPKACERLVAQGAISKLADVVHSALDMDVKEPAIQALIQITRQIKSSLRQEHLMKIQEALINTDVTSESIELMFFLSCNEHFTIETLPASIVEQYFYNFIKSLETYATNGVTKNLLCLLGLFANCLHVPTYENLFNLLQQHKNALNQIMDSNDMSDSMLWLLGNMRRHCGDHVLVLFE